MFSKLFVILNTNCHYLTWIIRLCTCVKYWKETIFKILKSYDNVGVAHSKIWKLDLAACCLVWQENVMVLHKVGARRDRTSDRTVEQTV